MYIFYLYTRNICQRNRCTCSISENLKCADLIKRPWASSAIVVIGTTAKSPLNLTVSGSGEQIADAWLSEASFLLRMPRHGH